MIMVAVFFTRNVSETHDLNNPTQGKQCGGKNTHPENQRLGETRPLLKQLD